MAEQYVVLGDVVRSREITDRDAFRARLQRACSRCSERDDVLAPFSVLKGIDEIGGVLSSAEGLYRIAVSFSDALRPHVIRLTAVGGPVDVGLDTGDVAAMDGPAFHEADDRLESMGRSGLRVTFTADEERLDAALTGEMNLLLTHRDGLTDRQREVIRASREHETQGAAAESLGITQQAVSKALRRAAWPMVSTIEERLDETLAGYDR